MIFRAVAELDLDAPARFQRADSLRAREQFQIFVFIHVELDPDLVQRRHRGQHRLAGLGVVADADVLHVDPAVDGRHHHGIAQIQPRLLGLGPKGFDPGKGLLLLSQCIVEGLLGDRAGGRQFLIADHISLNLAEGGFRLGHRRVAGQHRRLILAGFDAKQRLPLFHRRAAGHILLDDVAGDLGLDLGRLPRLDLADELIGDGRILGHDLHRLDFHGLVGPSRRLAADAELGEQPRIDSGVAHDRHDRDPADQFSPKAQLLHPCHTLHSASPPLFAASPVTASLAIIPYKTMSVIWPIISSNEVLVASR